ncbi:phosphopantetheine adenylyltransferase [Stagnimonas aquatica]|uniref:Phosphopantetheine adenylyltransferase n=1 Tax=Stagnimonas aquatica TaxID=2689987 RepID=A0A3N0VHN4_9GAMM|nr:phosphopantetheine adenylyltransferase [Stagnimonas aquatica]ROH91728.1 phosphopantetheine adenylyltransferase [Stagnimonas aquatica]
MNRAELALATALLLAGLLNALPVLGLLGQTQLKALYGLEVTEPSLRILLRHRALLFGLLGGAMMAAAFLPEWRLPAASAGLLSMLGYALIAGLEGGGNAALVRVVWADLAASLLLAAALVWSRL